MEALRYRLINSCASTAFTGNPICVALDEPKESLMQKVAIQMNLACTVFPVRTGPGSYRMRLFTPECEVPYAGSPSLAAAWMLGQGVWTQTTAGAVAKIEVINDTAWMDQPEPILRDIEDADVAVGLGLSNVERLLYCQVASNRYILAVTDDDPADLTPRPDVLMGPSTRYGGPALVGAVRKVNNFELKARLFGPVYGIAEDPACGAVAGALCVMMNRFFGTGEDVVIRQGEEIGRPSRIVASIAGGRIRMGGKLIDMGGGSVNLSDAPC